MTPLQVGQAVCQAVGLGCYMAWSFYVWVQYAEVLSVPLTIGAFSLSLSLVRDLLMALCAVAVAIASPSLRTLCARPVVTFALALVACVSCAGHLIPVEATRIVYVAGLLFAIGGIGSTLRIAWEESMSLLGILHITFCFAGGYLVGAFLFLSISLLPPRFIWVAFATMPLASWALLTVSSRFVASGDPATGGCAGFGPGIAGILRTVSWKILAAVVLVYVCYGVLRASQNPLPSVAASSLTDVVLTTLVSIMAISLGYLAFRRNVLISFYVAFPLLALASILPSNVDPYMVVATFASALVAMVLWLLIVEFIVKDGLLALACVALLRAAQLVGNLLGQGLGGLFSDESIVAVIVLLCVIGALLLLFGYRPPSFGGDRLEEGDSAAEGEVRGHDEGFGSLASSVQVATVRFGLTPREAEVLTIWAQGRAITYIESTLFISKSTVKTHLTRIYAKTGAENREALMVLLHELASESSDLPSGSRGA